MDASADSFVLKRALATDLLPSIESVLVGLGGAVPRANRRKQGI